ncbi:uncharacterized protein N7458_002295 [Penicillium daleae]|uniref:Uncharacterized protein n=1 Tax=Penicillium daleae TaxID=63821 RepID=A0AAD6CEF4_9EURO|nr:uncharacterized protein N7458_002295 [Penicillium daleae]KAJ5460743.1 hypothetical protein N7458_002295 [Penicillium daleae]
MLSWTSSWELMVERLVLEWKVTHGKWDEKRDGLYDKSKEKPPAYIDRFKSYNLITTLAPNESDGPDDKSNKEEEKLNQV